MLRNDEEKNIEKQILIVDVLLKRWDGSLLDYK